MIGERDITISISRDVIGATDSSLKCVVYFALCQLLGSKSSCNARFTIVRHEVEGSGDFARSWLCNLISASNIIQAIKQYGEGFRGAIRLRSPNLSTSETFAHSRILSY